MKVVHIAYRYGLHNTGGAAIAATRLHLALIASGIESHYVCIWKHEQGKDVHELPRGWRRYMYRVCVKISRCIWKFTPYRRSISVNVVPMFGLEDLLLNIRPNVVHVQWLNADVMSFEQLGRLRCLLPQAHFVINLHDFFMINAINPYPQTDLRYVTGFDCLTANKLERWLYGRKLRAVQQLKRLQQATVSFVGPSEWVVSCCRQSLIGRGTKAFSISNIIDAHFSFKPSKVQNDKFVILYGAYLGCKNWSKGFDDLVEALKLLPLEIKHSAELRIFGEDGADCKTAGIDTRFIGNISSPSELVRVYNEADVFAFPSREETQGMTKVEAMLCGLPVIAFDRTACAEGIRHQVSGWVARDGDFAQYAEGINWFYETWRERRLMDVKLEVSNYAKKLFSTEKIVNDVIRAYQSGLIEDPTQNLLHIRQN